MAIYTYRGCTIEVAKGGQTAKVSVPGGETRTFKVLGEADSPTPQVQAQRWARERELEAAEPKKPRPKARTPHNG